MKITTLIENLVYDSNLTAEHGFSILIEKDGKKILFDTGQSGSFINNAQILEINISEIDIVVISHGHYDHTGGLQEFIKYNKTANIYLKEQCFYEKYKSKEKYIGIPFNKNILENRLVFVKNITEIIKNVFIIPQINIYYKDDTHYKNMLIKNNNNFVQDDFTDEQFLVIKNKDSLIIISGCSHNGITNIIQTAIDYFKMPVELVLGGFHFKNENENKIIHSIDVLNKFNIKQIGVSHCTGIEQYFLLKNKLNASIFYNYTGNILNL